MCIRVDLRNDRVAAVGRLRRCARGLPAGRLPDNQADSPAQPVNYGGSVDEVDQPSPPIPDYDQPPCPVDGYAGGRWVNNNFHYNQAVTNVNVTVVHNTYNQTVINNVNVTHITNINRVSYAGGAGTRQQPTPQERDVAHESHIPPTVMQIQHETAARGNPQQNASRNVGRPPVAGAPRPGTFDAPGFTAARPSTPQYQPQAQPAARAYQPPEQAQHARDLSRPQGGNPQFELQGRQEQERQTLALQQEQEHRAFANQPNHGPLDYRAMEQQHQQQSQQLQQRHQQERRN